MIRVLHVTWRLSPEGGIPVVIRNLIRGHSNDAFDLHVATVRGWDEADDLDELRGRATIHPMGIGGDVGRRASVSAAARIAGLGRHLMPDVLHLHSGTAVYGVGAALAARGAARVLDVHDAPGHGRHGAMTEWLERRLVRRLGFHPIVHSTSVQAEIVATYGVARDRALLVHLGIDTDAFGTSSSHPSAWRQEAGFDDGGPLVLYVARLVPSKNVDLFVEVARRVSETRPGLGARFAVVAAGPEGPRLQRLIESLGLARVVRLVGSRRGRDLVDAYHGASLFLSTSAYEGFGLGVVEAMASGVPVVATSVGGVTDLVLDGVTGRLCPAGDAHALTSAVVSMLEDERGRRRMAAAGQQRARDQFSLPAMVDRYEAVYRQLLSSAG